MRKMHPLVRKYYNKNISIGLKEWDKRMLKGEKFGILLEKNILDK